MQNKSETWESSNWKLTELQLRDPIFQQTDKYSAELSVFSLLKQSSLVYMPKCVCHLTLEVGQITHK